MPLVVVCGQPASGKSTASAALKAAFESAGMSTEVVDEPSLHLTRETAYSDMVNEKNTRGAIRSAVERQLSKRGVLILDSLNNIKGYRYELHCIARAEGDRYCMVHIDTPDDVCRTWNAERPEESRYPDAVFEDLASRFETPIATNRWDSPLFTLRPCEGPIDDGVASIVAAVTAPEGVRIDCQAAGVARQLGKSQATTGKPQSDTNLLHEVDRAAQAVVTDLAAAQMADPGQALGEIYIGGHRLHVDKIIALTELRRQKRSFLKLATRTTFAKVCDPKEVTRMFVGFLQEQLSSS